MNIQAGIFWLILTVFLEARDQTPQGQKNIVKVILNRAEKRNLSIYDIVFKRLQFSCYNDGLASALIDVAYEAKHVGAVTENVMRAVDEWQEGDNLNGATLYYNPKIVKNGWPSTWDRNKTKIVAKEKDHVFLIEV